MHWFVEKVKTYYPNISIKPIAVPGRTVQIDLRNPLPELLSIIEHGGILTFDSRDLQLEVKSGFLINSSGTTGTPKTALYSFDIFLSKFKDSPHKPIETIMTMGLDHIGGMDVYFSIISRGGRVFHPDKVSAAEICQVIQDKKIHFISLTPTLLNMIFLSESHLKYDLSSLKIVNFGAEVMPAALLERAKLNLPHVVFKQTFGTTETGTLQVEKHPSDPLLIKIKGSKVIDGKLYVRSDHGMLRYLEQDSPLIDGYFPTGDLVTEHEGYLKILGRDNEVINIGGHKVIPTEVEEILLGIPHVKNAVVYGEKNLITGSILVAEIVWDNTSGINNCIQYIKQILKGKTEKHKIPAKIKLVEYIKCSTRMKKIRQER